MDFAPSTLYENFDKGNDASAGEKEEISQQDWFFFQKSI
jgi:hypothetical protein